ncbi:hypothetical protein PARPLA_01095 [Rhodobacteraceae bacterium THAF1]|uniref:hypothetical protein n=1 Tax=Palleronia sp. THAF1 TaxID=2587842 RepID=UPI000F3C1B4C|nr:hypothetical protein [Palleronia sp. THAF1]QFU07382.1 hypothetical protein FIU81_01705 [Palleronia sp. THAF1]VDC20706.1 hypothetical protein PARPLA_01095 [Rhodobacteraceae bacterium THAF1]
MDVTEIEPLFTRTSGEYVFARWGRAIAPVVFGVDDATLGIVKGAIEAVCQLAGHDMGDMDGELGVNFMVFFLREWDELRHVPDLDRLIEGLTPLLERLEAVEANQYRVFRFDEAGAIKAAFIFVRMDAEMSKVPAETVALSQVVQTILLWSDTAFTDRSALAQTPDGTVVLRPDIGALIRAAYDPVMPVAANDPAHALRLAARVGQAQ